MKRRIQPRPSRVGTGAGQDFEALEELALRREKHERLTRGRPERSFAEVLQHRLVGERAPVQAEPVPKGAIEPHLGLDPRQDASLAGARGHRSAKVIVKG